MTLRELLSKWEVDLDEILDTRIGGPGTMAGGPRISATLEYGYGAKDPEVTIIFPGVNADPGRRMTGTG